MDKVGVFFLCGGGIVFLYGLGGVGFYTGLSYWLIGIGALMLVIDAIMGDK